MGRFFNPNPPPTDYGYRPINTGGGGGVSRREKPKRDLASEKRDAEAVASKLSGGDPDKYADTLTKLGYAEDAIKYKDSYAKAEEQELKVQELETNQVTEQLRVASDLARAGREDLAIRVVNKGIDDPAEQYSSFKYKNGKVDWINNSGEKGQHDLDAVIKAGTKSSDQFKEQMANYRVKLSSMKDPRTMSPSDLLGVALSKQITLEGLMKKNNQTADEVIKANPHLENSPLEKDMIVKEKMGNLTPVISAMVQSNPGMFKVFGAKTPDDAAQIVVDIFAASQKKLLEGVKPAAEPKAGGSPNPKTTKGGESSSVSVSEKSHPAFKDAVLMVSPDGREGKVPADRVEEAEAKGYKVKP